MAGTTLPPAVQHRGHARPDRSTAAGAAQRGLCTMPVASWQLNSVLSHCHPRSAAWPGSRGGRGGRPRACRPGTRWRRRRPAARAPPPHWRRPARAAGQRPSPAARAPAMPHWSAFPGACMRAVRSADFPRLAPPRSKSGDAGEPDLQTASTRLHISPASRRMARAVGLPPPADAVVLTNALGRHPAAWV